MIELNEKDVVKKDKNNSILSINGYLYHFKPVPNNKLYNELISSYIAKELGIRCFDYKIASLNGQLGNLSRHEDFIPFNNIIPGNNNNLTDIWITLDNLVGNKNTEYLMKELLDIFVFDILIGNNDRNTSNYGILNNHFIIFDNDNMLNEDSIFDGKYTLGLDNSDTGNNLVDKLIDISEDSIKSDIKNKLVLIEDDNIDNILAQIEINEDVIISNKLKEDIKYKFKINRHMILREIKKYDDLNKKKNK